MKILFLFAIIGSSLAFSVDLNRALALPRNLCCLTTNAQSTCATQCSGRSCSATCTVRCGILMSTCCNYSFNLCEWRSSLSINNKYMLHKWSDLSELFWHFLLYLRKLARFAATTGPGPPLAL